MLVLYACIVIIAIGTSIFANGFVFSFNIPPSRPKVVSNRQPFTMKGFPLMSTVSPVVAPQPTVLYQQLQQSYDANDRERFITLFKILATNQIVLPMQTLRSYFNPLFIKELSGVQASDILTGLVNSGFNGSTIEQRSMVGNLFIQVAQYNPLLDLDILQVISQLSACGFKYSHVPQANLTYFNMKIQKNFEKMRPATFCQFLHFANSWSEFKAPMNESILLKVRHLSTKYIPGNDHANIILALGKLGMELAILHMDQINAVSRVAEHAFIEVRHFDHRNRSLINGTMPHEVNTLVKTLVGLVGMNSLFDRMQPEMRDMLQQAVAVVYKTLDAPTFMTVVTALGKMKWNWWLGTGPLQRGFEAGIRRHFETWTPKQLEYMMTVHEKDFTAKFNFLPRKLQRMILRKLRGLQSDTYDQHGNFIRPSPKTWDQKEKEQEEKREEIPDWVMKYFKQGPQSRPVIRILPGYMYSIHNRTNLEELGLNYGKDIPASVFKKGWLR